MRKLITLNFNMWLAKRKFWSNFKSLKNNEINQLKFYGKL